MTDALKQILAIVGNVEHKGGGANAARMYADMLTDIRNIAKAGLETPSPVQHGIGIDSRTGRAFGDHGTAMQAVDFALDHLSVERDTFFKCWREGDLDEWPEFYSWLSNQSSPPPSTNVNGCHPSHTTRSSDASSFDEICTKCGATDIAGGGWGRLAEPCTAPSPQMKTHVNGERKFCDFPNCDCSSGAAERCSHPPVSNLSGPDLERRIFEILTHGYPAPFARVDRLSKQIAALMEPTPAPQPREEPGESD